MPTPKLPPVPRRAARSLALLTLPLALLAACGGGGGSASDSDSGSGGGAAVNASASFPTGLAVAAPTDVDSSASVTAQTLSLGESAQRVAALARAGWQALREGDGPRLARVITTWLPMASAQAVGSGTPELTARAALLGKILSGDSGLSLASVLDVQALFNAGGSNVACYGPQMLYATHQDAGGGGGGGGGPASGQLPGGDLGLWWETEDGFPGTTACVAAQLSARVASVKHQANQGLILMAAMRRVLAASPTLALPAAGAATDLTSAFQAVITAATSGLPYTVTVEAATVALNAGATDYTYRLVLGNGLTGSDYRRGEVILRHTPGSDSSHYGGVLQVTGLHLGSDAAFGCADEVDSGSGLYKRAEVSTVRYSRAGSAIDFGSRHARYCGLPTSTGAGTDLGAELASFASDGQLDPTAKLSGTTRGGAKAWRGDFTRFGGRYDKDTVAGNFLLAWQAGPGDGMARALAATATLDAVSGDRTVKGYFAYTADIASTNGDLLGMVCNWAGPGASHTAQPLFQSQVAVQAGGSGVFAVSGSSRIAYAPTNSCSSTTTTYDADLTLAIDAGEGLGTVHQLDAPASGVASVQAEISSRGYSLPTLF